MVVLQGFEPYGCHSPFQPELFDDPLTILSKQQNKTSNKERTGTLNFSVQDDLENPVAFSRPNEIKQCNRTKLLLILRMTDSLCIQIGFLPLKMLASKSAWLHNTLVKRKNKTKTCQVDICLETKFLK